MITQDGDKKTFTGITVRLVHDPTELVTVIQGKENTETGTEHGTSEFDTTQETCEYVINESLEYSNLSEYEIELLLSSYDSWVVGLTVTIDQLLKYNNVLYKVLQAHTTQSDWTPDVADSLFTEATPAGTIMEWVQPTGAHDAYNLGDQVIYNSHLWETTIDANVWAPGVYGWTDLGVY